MSKTNTKYIPVGSFEAGAVNRLNHLFYSNCAQEMYETGLAHMYTSCEAVFFALAEKMFLGLAPGKTLKVHHLCSGNNPWTLWQRIGELCPRSNLLHVTVSDLVMPEVPEGLEVVHRLSLKTDACNLQDDFDEMEERFDVMFASYGFDSVWFEQDLYLVKKKGQWFQKMYQLQIPEENAEILKKGLLQGGAATISVDHLEGVVLNEKLVPCDLGEIPYGKEIAEYYAEFDQVECSFPGGLIAKIVQAFERQLTDSGRIILGEVCVPRRGEAPEFYGYRGGGVERSGDVARFKIEDYGIAREILAGLGYRMTLVPLLDLVQPLMGEEAFAAMRKGVSCLNYVVEVERF